MKIRETLERFDRDAREEFEALVERAERFLAEHHESCFELQTKLAAWKGGGLDRATENRALAIVDALRHLNRLVAAGVEAARDTTGDQELPA